MRTPIITMSLMALALGAAAQTEITGFVDAAHTWNPADQAGEFSLDQVEIDIVHQSSDRTLLRADIEWVKDGEGFVAQLEQGYMSWTSPCGNLLTFGKFNAPIGFEAVDAPDMFQYSHALVYDFGLPGNLTGASVAKNFGPGFDVVAYVANGWDANTRAGKNVTWGGRLGYATGGFAGGLSAITGRQDLEVQDEEFALILDIADAPIGVERLTFDPVPVTRTVFDVDLGYKTGKWLFGGEVNQGTATTHSALGAGDQSWLGVLAMSHVDFNDRAGLTVRYDHFDDQDGWAFGAIGGQVQTRQAFAIAPTFAIAENCGALVEWRLDKSDQDAFVDADGDPTDSRTTVAFEMTYGW